MSYLSNYLPEDIFSHFIHGKVMDSVKEEKSELRFRNSSNIQIEKKPCPCMANKVKDTPSS